ncbi:sugar phosphate nucleotidyltransferase [Sciscionella sediminilitoris]|uniref:sugar phosphate nucleotidyltransferase n=1 Tax=Sciscionella sediminilitoris TaxID=1445613 RepID=UPI0004DF4EF7|nr:NDP-sugar synthase [Sciscionella sp. SE31]
MSSGTTVSDVDAVVLVGGKGTRLRPLTLATPKPMLPTAGVPFLRHLLSRIAAAGVRHVVLGTSYKAEVFTEYFGDGEELGIELEYVVESEPLDTAGAIRNVADRLRHKDVLVFNGDILSGVDPRAVLATHRENSADATLHLVKVHDPRPFGCVPTDDEGWVTAFLEKSADPPTDQINAGCYAFRREVIEDIPAGRRVSVERETFPGLLAAGARVHGHVDSSYWLDLGTPSAFVQGAVDLATGLAPSAALPSAPGEAILLEDAVVYGTVTGGSTIGARTEIGAEAQVTASVVFDDAQVGAGALVRRSVIGAGARIGTGAVLDGAVIGDGAEVGPNCELLCGARVWPGVQLPETGIRFSSDE